jgi:phosphatidylglycerophosphate synthase
MTESGPSRGSPRREAHVSDLPNAITLSRLLLVLPFGWLLFAEFPRWMLLAVFALAALTDALDGLVARRLGAVTRAGARLDQVVDRIFTTAIVLLLLAHGSRTGTRSPAPEPALLLLLALCCAREIVGLPGVAIAWLRGKPLYHVERVGKLATLVQSVTLGAILIEVGWAVYLALCCGILGIASGANYIRYSLAPVPSERE